MVQTSFTVSGSEIGPDLCVRPSRLLGLFQDASSEDCDRLHIGRQDIRKLIQGIWVVTRTSLYLDEAITCGQYLLSTWNAGLRGVLWNRGYLVQSADGCTVARGVTQWTILSAELPRQILKLPSPPPAEAPFELPPLLRFRPVSLIMKGQRFIGRSLLDENRHCNNALAADILEDAVSDSLPLAGVLSRLRQLHIHYNGEAHCGETLDLLSGSDEQYQYVVTSRGGDRIHEAALCWA